MPAPVRLRPAKLTVSFMEVNCANVSVRSDGKRSVESLVTFFPFKVYFDLPKVYSSLSKMRAQYKVQVLGTLPPLPLRGRVMPPSGISLTLLKATASHRQG